MIFVSSSCVKNKKIKDSIVELANNGFRNIELSGGTEDYDGIENDILELKDKYNLNLLCHNYFPPPKEHFVLNLASLNNEVYKRSFNHIVKAISLSEKISAPKFGFHAGFYIDIKVTDIGKKITKTELFNREKCATRFCNAVLELQKTTSKVQLYIENNVYSEANFKTYNGEEVLMLTSSDKFVELSKKIDFNLLLDIAHLKVSSKTLGLSFKEELAKMINNSDYIHISDNDSLSDLNCTLEKDSILYKNIKNIDLKNKDITVEIYDSIDKIKESCQLLEELV